MTFNMNSPRKRRNHKKKTSKQKAKNNTTSTQNLTKKVYSTSITNKKIKNIIIKRSDPSIILISGKELIQQLFHNKING